VDIEILAKPDDVSPFVEDAQRAADSDKEALGFLPEQAFKQAADQGKLLVATIKDATGRRYRGHLLHGGVFPYAKIFQVYVALEFRGLGIGRRLVEAIVRRSENFQFMSILAQVADDLTANKFWERLGFELIRTKPGGRTTGRQINVRIRELNTPQLFGLGSVPARPSVEDLRLISRLFDVSPVYVLDLNVLFELVRKRANAEEVGRIVRASFNNLVRLAVTDEFIEELERTSVPSPTDPILEFALRLPRLQKPPSERLKRIIDDLGRIVFPNSVAAGRLRQQDQSDIVHLATAIHHGVSGFVTGEKAILRARADLQTRYAIDVVGADEFAQTVEPCESEAHEIQAVFEGQVLEGKLLNSRDVDLVSRFLERMLCPQQLAHDALRNEPGRPHRRMLVTCEGTIVAFASWDIPSGVRPHLQAFVCVDEDHSAVTLGAEFLLDCLSREALYEYPTQLSLRLLPGHVKTRRLAITHGFRPAANESSNTSLEKIALGQAVTGKNWRGVCQQLKAGMRLELPSSIPTFQSLQQNITVKGPTGQVADVPLFELETLISPSLFLLPKRSGAIVPIRRIFAADLIGGGRQLSLLAGPEAVLLRERVYFSHPRTAAVLTRGTPIIFYESGRKGGSASATAVARVVRGELISKDGATHEMFRRGVLDKKMLRNICLADKFAATTIDNIMTFRAPVRLDRLRSIGAIDGANLVTARSLRADQIIQIVEEGML
jgi:GNAT superfamily N-acetyltransferase/predicted nucleic acid-binding protein